jgi:hypothetical protein
VTLVALHVAAAWCMTGIGWTIHAVHYPLFGFVDDARWTAFHAEHSRRISSVVAVPWAIEGVTTALLLVRRPDGASLALVAGIAVSAALTVVGTVGLAIPAHQRLAAGPDPALARRLVTTGWLRTLAWTADGILATILLLTV